MRGRSPNRKDTFRPKGLGNAGSALAEMGIALPFFMILMLGAVDFGRVFYTSIAVTQAARAGTQFGAQNSSLADTTLYPLMRAAANNVAADYHVTIPSPTVQRYCTCTTGGSTVSCSNLAACGGAIAQLYVTTTIPNYTFSTFAPYPGIPRNIDLTRTATVRVR